MDLVFLCQSDLMEEHEKSDENHLYVGNQDGTGLQKRSESKLSVASKVSAKSALEGKLLLDCGWSWIGFIVLFLILQTVQY